MMTVVKREAILDGFEWISDASEDEPTKFDVVEETVEQAIEQTGEQTVERTVRAFFDSCLTRASSPFSGRLTSCPDIETSSTISHISRPESGEFSFSLSERDSTQSSFSSTSSFSSSRYSSCSCCSSGLKEFVGPPKKRILLAAGYGPWRPGREQSKETDLSLATTSSQRPREEVSPCFSNPKASWKTVVVRTLDDRELEYSFKTKSRSKSLGRWGYIRYEGLRFPFIFRNGHKMVPIAIVSRLLFRPCVCTLPRTVLANCRPLRRTSAAWEEIRCIETVPICRETKLTFGTPLVQWDTLLTRLGEIVEEISNRHEAKKTSRRTATCPWLEAQKLSPSSLESVVDSPSSSDESCPTENPVADEDSEESVGDDEYDDAAAAPRGERRKKQQQHQRSVERFSRACALGLRVGRRI